MAEEASPGEYGSWTAAELPLRIEYSVSILEEIRVAVVEGFQRIPRGGLEVGGALFGTHMEDRVRIEEWRTIECEHAKGPGFELSTRDEEEFSRTMRAAARDPRLEKLEPVGWFHSHTRSGIFLSEADLKFHNRYFPRPWQVALVLRPSMDHPMRGGFFAKEADGTIRAEASYQEFTLETLRQRRMPGGARGAPPPRRHPAVEPAPLKDSAPPPPAPAPEFRAEEIPEPGIAASPEALPMLFATHAPKPRRWGLAATLVSIGALAAAGAFVPESYWPWREPAKLALRVEDAGGVMHIEWDRSSRAIVRAQGGALAITDGAAQKRIELSVEELQKGSLSYARESGDVHLRMTVRQEDGRPLEEARRFTGLARALTRAAELERAVREKQDLEAEVTRLQEELQRETSRANQLRRRVRALQEAQQGTESER